MNNDSDKFDLEEGIKRLRENAEKGSIACQGTLAAVYMAMKNYDEAAIWGKRAASNGSDMGQHVLNRLKKMEIDVE